VADAIQLRTDLSALAAHRVTRSAVCREHARSPLRRSQRASNRLVIGVDAAASRRLERGVGARELRHRGRIASGFPATSRSRSVASASACAGSRPARTGIDEKLRPRRAARERVRDALAQARGRRAERRARGGSPSGAAAASARRALAHRPGVARR
jgi:hypothetical protein